MMEDNKIAQYEKIAQDFCQKILNGEYKEGDKISGRSTLASVYKVSPETIRKAMMLLSEKGIIEIKHGVGIFVDSVSKARQYADTWGAKESVDSQFNKVNELIKQSNEINAKLQSAIEEMINNFKYQIDEAISFEKVTIPEGNWLNNKTIGEVYFWNYTEATIVAVMDKETGKLQASPGPDFPLKFGDTLILVGKDNISFERVLSFITNGIAD